MREFDGRDISEIEEGAVELGEAALVFVAGGGQRTGDGRIILQKG
jgi:hypothetical protein